MKITEAQRIVNRLVNVTALEGGSSYLEFETDDMVANEND